MQMIKDNTHTRRFDTTFIWRGTTMQFRVEQRVGVLFFRHLPEGGDIVLSATMFVQGVRQGRAQTRKE